MWLAEKLTNEDGCSSRGIIILTITFEAVLRTMRAPIVPLAQCHIDNHFKLGSTVRSVVASGCPYGRMWHVGDGKFSPWIFAVAEGLSDCATFLL